MPSVALLEHGSSYRDAAPTLGLAAPVAGCCWRPSVRSRQPLQDRALGPIVSVAAVHEVFERRLHREQFCCLLLQLLDVRLGEGFDRAARAPAVLPQANQFGDLRQRKAEVP